jgi:hypothetical protein
MGLPWFIKKAVDFDVWFNRKILQWSDTKNFKWVFLGAEDDEVRAYVKSKFGK